MCKHPDPLNHRNVDALNMEALYNKTTEFWFVVGEPLYIGCAIGHAGPTGPSSDPDEPWNLRIAHLGGAIGNLKQTILWLEKALQYEKEKARNGCKGQS